MMRNTPPTDSARTTDVAPAAGIAPTAHSGQAYGAHGSSRQRHLTILHAGRHGEGGIEHVIADFVDALGAYERLSAAHAHGGTNAPALDINHLRIPDLAAGDAGAPTSPEETSALLVIAAEDVDERASKILTRLLGAWKRRRLYAIVTSDATGAAEGHRALDLIERSCRDAAVIYSGGAVLCGALLITRHAGTPRMGRLRRARSEHIDRIIAAVRIGCSVAMLPDTEGADTLVARCPYPRPLYRILTGSDAQPA